MEQCVPIFEREGFPTIFATPPQPFLVNGSNYELIDQPNGLCADFLACAWTFCEFQPLEDIDEDKWNLPYVVVHPLSVSHITASIAFAREHGIGMSVKTSGHS
eukprot:2556596-Ditylum_brightwellii.AAC.1